MSLRQRMERSAFLGSIAASTGFGIPSSVTSFFPHLAAGSNSRGILLLLEGFSCRYQSDIVK